MHFSLKHIMKKIRIEVQTALLALIMIVAVAVSGFYFFRSLSRLVDVVQSQALSDPVLIEIRNISSKLPDVENKARLFILSGDAEHLFEYRQINDSLVENLQVIDKVKGNSIFTSEHLDSIATLVLKRLLIWNEILEIHISENNQPINLPDITRRLQPLTADTVVQEVARKGFFANLFKKKKPEVEIIVPQSDNLQAFQQEMIKLQRTIQENTDRIKSREAELLEANQEITFQMYNLIWQLEALEQRRLENNTIEAGMLALAARQRIAFFGVFMVALIILLIALVFRFIRKNREWQSVLIEAKQQAEELAHTKEMFIANVSHEMRTPVNAVYGVTEQVLQRELDRTLREDLTIVMNSAKHLLSLVNDTLDLAKINANLLSINPVDFNPATILKETVELFGPEATARNLGLIYDPPNNLPAALYGDPVRLKQMVINLLSNALKFTDKGYVKLEASVYQVNEDCKLKVLVADTGMGIKENDLPKVFDEFMQADGNDPVKHRGTGLGLSIVKKLAGIQGGEVEIKSQPGEGTEVSFTIIYKKGNPEKIEMGSGSLEVNPGKLHSLKLLVVDDEAYNRHLVRMIFQKWGIQFSEAANGQEAVYMSLANEFDAILMDIRMPVKDGLTASKEILAKKPESIIIALTATTGKDEVQTLYKAGIKACLAKPFGETQLAGLLTQFFGEQAIPGEMEVSSYNYEPEEIEIDLKELSRISDGNRGFYLELIQIFISSTERGMRKMHEACSSRNFELLSDIAHKMASPVKHIQANKLYEMIKELEKLDFEKVSETKIKYLIDNIEAELLIINNYLRKEYEKEKQQTLTSYPDTN
jgi:signal transduction histidine kinase/DNA-binding response OmpR family regulator